VNDLDAHVGNFWRATIADPEAVAKWADGPVNEADLHARHRWLIDGAAQHRERMHTDPDYFDAKIAGWWVWGLGQWIGHGWCQDAKRGGVSHIHRMPSLGTSGRGTHSPEAGPLVAWFSELRDRLRRTRVACGDWSRVVTGAITGASNTLENMGMLPCAVFLDPPYPGTSEVYTEGTEAVAGDVRAWAIENGDNSKLRIALCGYEGETTMPTSWTTHAWKAKGGYGNQGGDNENARRERIWFSPHCLALDDVQRSLFGAT
jgi:DNA adenine methylase